MKDTGNQKKPGSGWLGIVTDYGPLLVFFVTYRWFAPDNHSSVLEIAAIVKGTLAFMAASLVALAVSKWRLGRISPMLWFSTALILGFGTLTVFFGDPVFVQVKPTIIYLVFGIALLAGWWRGRALLKILLEAAFEGLSDEGWLKLSRNWGVFFLVLAALNEGLRWNLDFGSWLAAKLWVFLPLSFLFTFTQIPMLMRHGMGSDATDEALSEEPPTGG